MHKLDSLEHRQGYVSVSNVKFKPALVEKIIEIFVDLLAQRENL
jgi:hypothetical protein